MYASIVIWTLEPGTMERSVGIVNEQLIPAVNRVVGLQQHLVITAGENEVTTVFVYDNQADADAGYAHLLPLAQQDLKGIVRSVQRDSGTVRSGG
jgi:hypothetical protein